MAWAGCVSREERGTNVDGCEIREKHRLESIAIDPKPHQNCLVGLLSAPQMAANLDKFVFWHILTSDQGPRVCVPEDVVPTYIQQPSIQNCPTSYNCFDIYPLQKISVSRTSRSARRDLALLQTLVLLGKHLSEDGAHRYAERTRRNANHVGAGIGRTPGLLPHISVRAVVSKPRCPNDV